MDRNFVAQLNDYRITTAEILYWMPDHKHVLQSYRLAEAWTWPPASPTSPSSSISGNATSTASCTACRWPTPS